VVGQDIWFEILKKIGLDADSCLLQSGLQDGLVEAGMNLHNAQEISSHFSNTECIPLESALDVCKTYRVPGKFRMAMTLKEQFSDHANEDKFRASVKKMFDSMDADKGGTIDQQEMIAGLAKRGLALSAASADDLMRSVDEDGSGEIDFEEVCKAVCTWGGWRGQSPARGVWGLFRDPICAQMLIRCEGIATCCRGVAQIYASGQACVRRSYS